MDAGATAELRKWWNERGNIWGHVYNDPGGFWEDGDLGSFKPKSLVDCGNFYILHTDGTTIFKMMKSQEIQKE